MHSARTTTILIPLAAICAAVAPTVHATALPAGYTQLAYIESTGTQYIDTGCTPTRYFRAVVDMSYTTTNGTGGFGYAAGGSAQSFRFWRSVADGVATYKVNVNDKYGTENHFPTTFLNDTARHVVDISDSAKYFDGVRFGDRSGLTKTLAGTFYLFAQHWGWSPNIGSFGSYRVYSCQLYEGATLVRDFVPCTDGNGKGGLYDLVNGKMYYNKASGNDFVLGPDSSGSLFVSGKTLSGAVGDYGNVSPAYGFTNGIPVGGTIPCAAPAVWTNAACNTAARCVGYKVYTNGFVYAEGNATNFTYVHPDCATGASLVWQWAVEYKITTSTAGSGTAAPGEQWVAEGGAATVTATPGAAQSFHKWTGDVPAGVNVFSPSISFSADQPRALVAGFGNAIYLSPDGNDGNDGTSWATALGTMTNAIAHGTVNGSVVNIAAGTYPLPYTLNLTNAITLRGATGHPEDVIIERPASAKTNYRLFDMHHGESVLESLTLQRGCHATVYVYGGGVYIYSEGGTVTNCILRGNRTDGHHGSGSAVYCGSSSGVVTHCVISNNTTSIYDNNSGNAVSMQYGRIDNCLITKNSDMTSNYGGMIALNNSAVAENCTVVANSAKACSGIYLYNNASSAKVRNCVIAYNTSTSARAEDIVWRVQTAAHASAFVNCVSDFHAPNANCHAGPDLVFADATAGDWRPTISSSAVDVGGTIANNSTLDLDGNPRVVDAIDAGCYELQKNGLMAGFTPSAPNGFTPASVTFTATVIGAGDGDVLEYRWDFDNDGQIDDVTSLPSATHVYTSGGVYSVSLTVADTTTDETATTTMNNVFKANPRILYVVNGNSGAAEPYDTWAIAADTIQKAINYSAAGAEVIVSNGIYSLTAGVNVNKEIVLHGLTGNPEDIVLDGRGSVRCLEMNAGIGGLVHSLTMHRGYVSGNWVYGGGAFVHTAGGTISNCIVRGCHGGGKWGAGGGLYASCDNALFTHCIITNNTSSTGTNGGYITGTAVHLEGAASLAHSLVADNRYTGGWCESTVRVDSGAVRFCTIVGNKARDFGGVNLYGTKAKVEYCIIAGNTSSWTATNAYPNAARYKVWGAGRTFTESNVASDDATRATPTASLQITNCVADAVLVNATCRQASLDAILPHYTSRGDVAPGAFSPAFNAVKPENARAMPATDVFGRPRLFGSKYDLGAVEGQRGTALFLMLQ